MKINLSTSLLSGIMFAALGAASMAMSARYHIGSAARMGPGYFPLIVGIALLLLGTILIVVSFFDRDELVKRIELRPIVCILLGIVLFGGLIESGLITATLASVLVASFARPIKSYSEVVLVALGLTAFSVLVFVYGLNLPMRLLPF